MHDPGAAREQQAAAHLRCFSSSISNSFARSSAIARSRLRPWLRSSCAQRRRRGGRGRASERWPASGCGSSCGSPAAATAPRRQPVVQRPPGRRCGCRWACGTGPQRSPPCSRSGRPRRSPAPSTAQCPAGGGAGGGQAVATRGRKLRRGGREARRRRLGAAPAQRPATSTCLGVNLHVDVVNLRHDGYRRRARVHPPACLGGGHALRGAGRGAGVTGLHTCTPTGTKVGGHARLLLPALGLQQAGQCGAEGQEGGHTCTRCTPDSYLSFEYTLGQRQGGWERAEPGTAAS